MIHIREATINDISSITVLFKDTVETINAKDYSEKQINAWSSSAFNIEKWGNRIKTCYFIVAELNEKMVGFAYLNKGNYFDGLFVNKDFQRQGIATKLLRIIESQVMANGYETIRSDVSITALPFFEYHYYEVVKKQKKELNGVFFENFIVSKEL